LKKSDSPTPAAALAHGETREPPLWQAVLRSNWTIPLALLLLWPLNYLFHHARIFDSGAGRAVLLVNPYVTRIVLLIGISIIAAVSLQLINGTSGQFSLGHAGFMAVGAYLAGYPMQRYSADGANPLGVLLFYVGLAALVAIAGFFLLALFLLIRTSARIHPQLPTVLLLIVAAWFLWDFSAAARAERAGNATPAWLIWSRGIALLGDLFDAIANRTLHFAMTKTVGKSICFLIAILGGGACASVAGLIVGLPTLRLRGDYLAIATLGFAEIIRVVINNSAALGGARGMMGHDPKLTTFGWVYAFVMITVIVVWRIVNSAKGRTLIAVREDEIAAGAVGIDTTRYRVFAFIVGSFFAGVGGALFAHMSYLVHPQEFGFLRSVELVVMVTLGGLGSISGAIATAAVLTLLPELLRGFAEWRMILYSLLLIVMMLVRPQGLLGSREIWPFRRGHRKPVPPPPTREPVSAAP
jgi:branched-chain amino acid transport system permease protein